MDWHQPVVLERMSQQSGLLGAEDDWTGVTSSAQRRKVQNRINQRAYRKRKQNDAKQRHLGNTQSLPLPAQNTSLSLTNEESSSPDTSEKEIERYSPQDQLWNLFYSSAERTMLDRPNLTRLAMICKLSPMEQQKMISDFQKWIASCHELGSPRTDHLLVLVKFNVFRALVSNSGNLGYAAGKGIDDDDTLSPLTDPSHPRWTIPSVPVALRPTKLQRQIPHHPWIDVLPDPGMRDNLLLAGDNYDDLELCSDLVGFFSESKGRTGMIVWGEPWDVAGWELTESFVKNWGWTVEGCEQLLQATNYWRERRGERPLRARRILYEEP